jgi:hypothetical protein
MWARLVLVGSLVVVLAACSLAPTVQEAEDRSLNEIMSPGSPTGSTLIESRKQVSTGSQENCFSMYAEALYGSPKSRLDTLEFYYRRVEEKGWTIGELSRYQLTARSQDERFALGVGIFTPRVATSRLYPYVRMISAEAIDSALEQYTTAFTVYMSFAEPWMQSGCP